MNAKAEARDWRKYDQGETARLTIRIDRRDKAALESYSNARGQNMTDLVLAYLRPVFEASTAEGQHAHDVISGAVQSGIAWNRAENGGGPGPDAVLIDTLHWHTLELPVYEAPDGTRYAMHRVRQREGVRRMDAVQQYVDQLLRIWAEANDREGMLRELREGTMYEGAHVQFRFAIAYVNMRDWSVFPSVYEMELQRKWYPMETALPDNGTELEYEDWAREYLTTLWMAQKNSAPGADGTQQINPAHSMENIVLRHYAHLSDHDNIEQWARFLLYMYHEKWQEWFGPMFTLDGVKDYTRSLGLKIKRMRLMD